MNIQNVNGQAKPYQIRQFLKLVEEYNLQPGEKPMRDYHINIFHSDEEGGYIADIPDLAHFSAFGESPEAALRELQIAKSLWLSVAKEAGKPVPPPVYRPVIYQAIAG